MIIGRRAVRVPDLTKVLQRRKEEIRRRCWISVRSDSASGCTTTTTTTFPGDRCCYDRAALVPSRGTIMIYFRPHDGRSLRYNANARHLNVLVVPLFPLWIIGAFCVKDSKWLLNFVVVFYRICASFRRSSSGCRPGSRFSEFLPFPATCLSNVNKLFESFEEGKVK